MLKTKKFYIISIVAILLLVWWFFAPIKWTFGLRQPKNFEECNIIGGKNDMLQNGGQRTCSWQDSHFLDESFISPFK